MVMIIGVVFFYVAVFFVVVRMVPFFNGRTDGATEPYFPFDVLHIGAHAAPKHIAS